MAVVKYFGKNISLNDMKFPHAPGDRGANIADAGARPGRSKTIAFRGKYNVIRQ